MQVQEQMTDILERLAEARRRERAQTRFYRSLASAAEMAGEVDQAERLNALHADEQHHLSRLTARMLELDGSPEDLRGGLDDLELAGWEEVARPREEDEVAWYEALLDEGVLDPHTTAVVEEILASERQHRDHLGGKWMPA
jgi:rubrerythrin